MLFREQERELKADYPVALEDRLLHVVIRLEEGIDRLLAEVGYDYSTLIVEARVEVATRLLAKTDAPSIDIA